MRVLDSNNNRVNVGDEITDFRGKKWILKYVTKFRKVVAKDPEVLETNALASREFFPSVFNLTIEEDE